MKKEGNNGNIRSDVVSQERFSSGTIDSGPSPLDNSKNIGSENDHNRSGAEPNSADDMKEQKRTSWLISGTTAVTSYANNISQPYIPFYLARLRTSTSHMGIFQGFQSLLPNIFQLLWGYASDRFNRRVPFVVAGTLISALTLLLIAFVSDTTVIIILLSVSAIFTCMSQPAWSALLGDKIGHGKRGKYFSQFLVFGMTAGLVGTVTVLFVFYIRPAEDISAYRWLFIAAAAIVAMSLVFVLPIKEPKKRDSSDKISFIRPSQMSREFRYFLIAMFVYNFFMALGWPLFYITQADVLHATNIEIAIATFVSVGATIAFQPFIGKLVDKSGPSWLITASRFIFAVTPFGFAFASSMFHVYLTNIIAALAIAIINVAVAAYILDMSPPETKAEYFAYYNMVCGVAGFLGSLLGGFMAEYLAIFLPLSIALMVMYFICGFGRIASGFMFFRIHDRIKYPSTPRQVAAAYVWKLRYIWRKP